MNKAKRQAKRAAIAVLGTIVLLIGIVAIPYPGPGWLIVFAGLAILSTEFEWAGRLLERARSYYDGWVEWLKRQHWAARLLVLAFTGLIIVVTVWLLNGFGILNAWLQLGLDWLQSPLFRS
jgi:uncharacterized protein (TIGR02611 family)